MHDIEELINKGESQNIEFKKSLSLTKEGLKSISAMLNTDTGCGLVIFGVTDKGEICGIDPGDQDTIQRNMTQKISQLLDPRPILDINIVTVQNKELLVIRGKRLDNIPYYEFDGRVYVREGTSNVEIGLTQKEALRKKNDKRSHNGPWICRKCNTWTGMMIPHPSMNNYLCRCGGMLEPA